VNTDVIYHWQYEKKIKSGSERVCEKYLNVLSLYFNTLIFYSMVKQNYEYLIKKCICSQDVVWHSNTFRQFILCFMMAMFPTH
jgi:hypothetical protein